MSDSSCSCKCGFRLPSLVKKYLMAVTGLVLVGFVGFHMLGNLQMFESPEAINKYAHFLQTLPWEFLWGFRIGLVLCLILHFWMGALLRLENNAARPQKYAVNATLKASLASRTMIYTGIVVAVFFVLHILHFTVQSLEPVTKAFDYVNADGKIVHDVYAMVVYGFAAQPWYAWFYILAVALIGFHLSHGVSSMFQSVGLRNETLRKWLGCLSAIYGLAVFAGFAFLPSAVLTSKYVPCVKLFPVQQIVDKGNAWDGKSPIFVEYAKESCHEASASCPSAK